MYAWNGGALLPDAASVASEGCGHYIFITYIQLCIVVPELIGRTILQQVNLVRCAGSHQMAQSLPVANLNIQRQYTRYAASG